MFTLWSKLLSMGARCSSMFQRQRDEDVPDRNGGGSHQDTDLEGVINENVEIEERNDRTPDSDQLENEGKRQDTGEAQAQKDGPPDAPKRGKKRGATTATNARKRTKRAQNWKPDETLKLIELRMQPPLDTGKSEWEAISVQIPERTAKQCQQRWDTVVKPYKKIKRHCDANGKAIGQVTEEELRSMNVDWRCWRDNQKWYNLIHEYYLRLSSDRPSHDLNVVAASTGISSGGNGALSSGVAATTFPVEQREPSPAPVTEGAASWRSKYGSRRLYRQLRAGRTTENHKTATKATPMQDSHEANLLNTVFFATVHGKQKATKKQASGVATKSTTGVSVRNPDDQVTYPSSLFRSSAATPQLV